MAGPRQILNVKLEVVNNADTHSTRMFTLKSPTYAIRVGRGSKSGNKELFPARHNSWFESRVMSREHAVFKADPDTKQLYLEDVSSMHGTYIGERKMKPREREALRDQDLVRFGAEVTRGPESFPPLEVVVSFQWLDDLSTPSAHPPRLSHSELQRNSFTVPDDDEYDDDDEVEFIQESICAPRVEVIIPSRTFAVPESNSSCAGSFTSEDAPSEPLTPETTRLLPHSSGLSGPSGLSEAEKQADEEAMVMQDRSPTTEQSILMSKAHSAAELFRVVQEDNSNIKERERFGRSSSGKTIFRGSEKPTIDIDLTESESDSDDGYSHDLWVEDSELDAGENEEIADTHKSQLLDQGDDCNDDEEKDEVEKRLRSASDAEVAERDCYSKNIENCFNDAAVPDVSKTRYGLLAVSQLQGGLAPATAFRAPSPSDAAMAKPTEAGAPIAPTAAPQAPRPLLDFYNSPIAPMTADYQMWPSPFADCGKWPYRPPPGPANYMPPTYNEEPLPFSYDGIRYPVNHSGLGYGSGLDNNQLFLFGGASKPGEAVDYSTLPTMAPLSHSGVAESAEGKTTTTPAPTATSTGKLTIQDIVDNNALKAQASDVAQKLKRKAADISTGRGEELETHGCTSNEGIMIDEITHDDAQPQDRLQESVTSLSETSVLAVASSDRNSRGQSENTDEPQKKRAKTGSSFAKSAALVVAGTLIGAVGTVAGLVALPPDFFV